MPQQLLNVPSNELDIRCLELCITYPMKFQPILTKKDLEDIIYTHLKEKYPQETINVTINSLEKINHL